MKTRKAKAKYEFSGPFDSRNLSYAKEIKAIIKRADKLFGGKHWQSVGNYFESIVRNKLVDWIPQRCSIDTGFVVSGEEGKIQRSKQIDIIIWDSQNFAPVFRDRSFVLIHPASLRVAIEVKRTLDATRLQEGLTNLDSLSQFIPVNAEYFKHMDPKDRPHFRRYLVAGQSKITFPDLVLNGLYKYYQSFTADNDGDAWTIEVSDTPTASFFLSG